MIKSFSGQVVFCFATPEPYLLTLTKTDYPSIVLVAGRRRNNTRRRKDRFFCGGGVHGMVFFI